uniref:Uncharacterized protein n=1 Tax=Panagrolaimus superbus TaxID=310955 RepID=A0A914YM29_9BILA
MYAVIKAVFRGRIRDLCPPEIGEFPLIFCRFVFATAKDQRRAPTPKIALRNLFLYTALAVIGCFCECDVIGETDSTGYSVYFEDSDDKCKDYRPRGYFCISSVWCKGTSRFDVDFRILEKLL